MTQLTEFIIDGTIADEIIEFLRERVDTPTEGAALLVLALWKLAKVNESSDEEALDSIRSVFLSMRREKDLMQ